MTENIPFIDTHAHLSMLGERGINAEERAAALFAEGFGGIVDIGTRAGDLGDRVKKYSKFTGIKFSAGIWPSKEAISQRRASVEELEKQILLADTARVAAVGECGLDHHRNTAGEEVDLKEEAELFELQLDLAARRRLPVLVHSRDAAQETLRVLSLYPGVTALIHCYSYGAEEVRAFLDLGCYISFAGNLTYKNSWPIREALCVVPDESLLFETDAPYLAPLPYRGKAADPGMVAETYRFAAELKKRRPEDLAALVKRNAERLFGPFICGGV